MLAVLMINVIMIMIVVSDDPIFVRIVLGWFVVVILGSLSCWGGDKTCLQGIIIMVMMHGDFTGRIATMIGKTSKARSHLFFLTIPLPMQ